MGVAPAVPAGLPTLSQLKTATFDHLGSFAGSCEQMATHASSVFGDLAQAVTHPGGVAWEGAGGTAASDQAHADVRLVRSWAFSRHDAAGIARRGQERLQAAQRDALDAVAAAQRDDFIVGEDYTCTDTRTVTNSAELAQRQSEAQSHASFIRHRVANLVGHDQSVATELRETTSDWGTLAFPEAPADPDEKHNGVQLVDNHYPRKPSKDDGELDWDNSLGPGGDKHVAPHGEIEREFGTPTGPHQPWEGASGEFDDGRGSWEVSGPGSQGGMWGTERTDGFEGHYGVDAWATKGGVTYEADIGGGTLSSSTDGYVGAHANLDDAFTDHGISGGVDVFAGAQLSQDNTYHLGPVDIGLGATAKAGAGFNLDYDIGWEDRTLYLGGSAGAAWGPGGAISPHIAIDTGPIVDGMTKAVDWVKGFFN